MTNISLIENKISIVKKYLKILDSYSDIDSEILKNNIDKKGAVERYLYLLAQSTIDLAESFVSFKRLNKPMSYSESFEELRTNNYISNDLCTKLIRMTGFRNVLAYGYEKVDNSILIEALNNSKNDVLSFIGLIENTI